MNKPKYEPQEKPYSEDINDLVELELEKGGLGSGIRGHKTNRDKAIRNAELNMRPDLMEHHNKRKREERKEAIARMSPAEKEAKIRENDAKISAMRRPKIGT